MENIIVGIFTIRMICISISMPTERRDIYKRGCLQEAIPRDIRKNVKLYRHKVNPIQVSLPLTPNKPNDRNEN